MKAQKWEAETEEDISEACSTEEKESLVLCSSQLHFRGQMSGFCVPHSCILGGK